MHEAELCQALERARAGDEAGFTELWHLLQPLLLRYLRVLIPQAAEDIASEAWLKAAGELRGFRGDGTAFRVWLFRVARNRAVDELRREGRHREAPAAPQDIEEYTDDREADRDTAASALERLSTDQALRLVAALPKDQAEAVLLRVMVGLDVARTAEVLGKRAGAVRINAMRGLRRLAKVLGENGAGPPDSADLADSADAADGAGTGVTGATGAAGAAGAARSGTAL